MTNFVDTSGLASAIQVIDSTGMCIHALDYSGTGAAPSATVFDPYGAPIQVETLAERLASIRRKSHSDLGEAWARLAKM